MTVLELRVDAVARRVGPPASLTAALEVVGTLGLCTAADAALAVWARRLSERSVHPAGLLHFAQRFGIRPEWSVHSGPGAAALVGTQQRRGQAAQNLRTAMIFTPVTTVAALGARLGLSRDVIVSLVADAPSAVLSGDWVARLDPTASGRLGAPVIRTLRQGPASTATLQESVTRALRYRADPPPAEALEAWLAVQPWIGRRRTRGRSPFWVMGSMTDR